MIAPSAQGLQVKHIVGFYIEGSQASITKTTFIPFSFLSPYLILSSCFPKALRQWDGSTVVEASRGQAVDDQLNLGYAEVLRQHPLM